MDTERVTAVILAAGSARRMGTDKLAVRVGGEPLLARALRPYVQCRQLGVIDEVVVVVRPGYTVPLAGVRVVENLDHEEGMGSSLRTGVAAAGDGALLLGLGDLPWLRPETVAAVVDQWRRVGGVVVPMCGGRRGHPVVVAGSMRGDLAAARGDAGARALLGGLGRLTTWQTPDPGIYMDVDTPADLPWEAPVETRP